jgi:hypothetical protein
MSVKWQEHQHNNPATSAIVQEGLDKLEVYRNRADLVPAYVLAMGALYLSFHAAYSLWTLTSDQPFNEA